jgi:hypothetical protein
MDTHDLHDMLDGPGAVWTTLDYPDDRPALYQHPPRYGRRNDWWQTTQMESDHLDQPDFDGPWDRLRWFMSKNLRQQRELAVIADDTADLTRIEMEKAALEFVSEADAVIATLRDREHIS